MKFDGAIRINAYEVISRAVESGARRGIRRAYKHDERPSNEYLAASIETEIMSELCEVIQFEDVK